MFQAGPAAGVPSPISLQAWFEAGASQNLGFRVFGFRVFGLGFRFLVQGLGFFWFQV